MGFNSAFKGLHIYYPQPLTQDLGEIVTLGVNGFHDNL